MPKVYEIKHARKDYPAEGISKGDPYFKWSIKTGPASGIICRSKTYPKPSQLTLSPFTSELLSIQEDIEGLKVDDFETAQDLSSALDEIIGRIESLSQETLSSLENMPEGLQQGDVGQLLQERVDGLDNWVSELQGVDLNFEFDQEEPEEPTEDMPQDKITELEEAHTSWEDQKAEAESDFIDQAIAEIQSMDPGL